MDDRCQICKGAGKVRNAECIDCGGSGIMPGVRGAKAVQKVIDAAKEAMKPTGTREWASVNYNIQKRCEHGCIYCYACANALRFGQCQDYNEWANKTPTIDMKKVNKKWRKVKGTIMFPTTHDITPINIGAALACLRNMLKAGNNVLIVSKPHLTCIKTLCDSLTDYKDQILFRFTIGSPNSATLKFWEPGAPSYEERKACLIIAFNAGYKTSVSSEPYLDGFIGQLIEELTPYITDALWLGPMNKMKSRVKFRGISFKEAMEKNTARPWTEEEWRYWKLAQSVQTEGFIKSLYDTLNGHPKIKWKNRIKEVLGLPIPKEIGLDE